MQRTLIKDTISKIGEKVRLMGWIDIRRDHGKLIFLDLRDMTGKVQMVVLPTSAAAHAAASAVRTEWAVAVTGTVAERPEKLKNPALLTGSVEIQVEAIEVLSEAETPPIDVAGDGLETHENVRMEYRYLDLRRPRLQKNIRNRHKIIKFVRDFLDGEGFIEIETPILTKSTPEGARDYVVPSRLQRGMFYALPQSPQQYKQLLMSAGMERYFQVARCFRDEDTRGDRQPEFTQLDLEMSFVAQEDVMAINERMIIEMVKKVYPQKKIQETPFPRITYKEAMEKYGSDRPDVRSDKNDPDLLAFCWVVDFPFFEKTEEGGWTFTHNPFSAPKPEHMEALMEGRDVGSILTTQYDMVLNGFEIGGGSIRNHRSEALQKVFEILGYEEARIRENFGHILTAFKYGTPPHGGLAFGLDRVAMILENESSIREVIAFPKTGDARDLMMRAPSGIAPEQLKELGIRVDKK